MKGASLVLLKEYPIRLERMKDEESNRPNKPESVRVDDRGRMSLPKAITKLRLAILYSCNWQKDGWEVGRLHPSVRHCT